MEIKVTEFGFEDLTWVDPSEFLLKAGSEGFVHAYDAYDEEDQMVGAMFVSKEPLSDEDIEVIVAAINEKEEQVELENGTIVTIVYQF